MKLRKFSKILFMVVLSALMCLQMAATAFAYETTYTVRILPGAQGSVGGGEIVYSGLHYGDTVGFSVGQVGISADSKYYVKGLKDSGKDNNHPSSDFKSEVYLSTDGAGNYSIKVTKDQDFVVSYGLKANSVAYTVNYIDNSGNALAASRVYYGNVGDKPVISYLYVDGYNPQAYNLTKTLSSDESQNVFNFIYTKIQVEQPTTTQPVTTVAEPETTTTIVYQEETTTQRQPQTTGNNEQQTTTARQPQTNSAGEIETIGGNTQPATTAEPQTIGGNTQPATTAEPQTIGGNTQPTTKASETATTAAQPTPVQPTTNAAEPETTAAVQPTQAATSTEPATTEIVTVPVEIIDLDVPMGNVDLDNNDMTDEAKTEAQTEAQAKATSIFSSPIAIIGIIAAIVIILVVIVLVVVKRKK